jgi:hypothetical protein
MSDNVLNVIDIFGKTITLSKKRLSHILKRPEMLNQQEKIKQTLETPAEIRKSVKDATVWLYYKFFRRTPVSQKYLAVVVKVLNKKGVILTSYFTDRIKKGELIWKKD